MNKLQQRIASLLKSLNQGIYEKENETALALLAALAGESILLLGPPGVAKSMVARCLKHAFVEAQSFEYLMSRFSTPDEIFGPVSISKLKTDDQYVRVTDGYLPSADVVFLDEIWKAGPAIQNSLLTVLNEKLFRNGHTEEHLPLKLLVVASNELPAKGEGLEALWDRFLIRVICHNIENEETFQQMLVDETIGYADGGAKSEPLSEAITDLEYTLWQKESRNLPLTNDVLLAISSIRQKVQHVQMADLELPRNIYISDRRWKHIIRLLKMSAYIHGSKSVEAPLLLPLFHCLWNEPDEIPHVQRIVIEAIFSPVVNKLMDLRNAVKADLRACRAKEALSKAIRENDHRDDNLLIVDRFFYQIDNHGTGNSFVFITDFKQLPTRQSGKASMSVQGAIYADPMNPKRTIVRMSTPDLNNVIRQHHMEHVTLCRDDAHIYINGIAFKMRVKGAALLNPAAGTIGSGESISVNPLSSTHYEEDIEYLCTNLDDVKQKVQSNIFTDKSTLNAVNVYVQSLYKQIALVRADICKLLYDEV